MDEKEYKHLSACPLRVRDCGNVHGFACLYDRMYIFSLILYKIYENLTAFLGLIGKTNSL
jgi:hypothetical protein